MSVRNMRMAMDGFQFARWRGAEEVLHAAPRQTIGKTNLVPKTRQSGINK